MKDITYHLNLIILAKPLRLAILCISPLFLVRHPSITPIFPPLYLIWKFIDGQSKMINPSIFFLYQFGYLSLFFIDNFIFLQNLIQKNLCFMTLFFLLAYAEAEYITEVLFNLFFTGCWWHHVNMEGLCNRHWFHYLFYFLRTWPILWS